MAEEDMIFGKNRHFFGGIEPSNMLKFNATVDNAARTVLIEAELPKDTVVDGQTLCTVAGAVIRRRADTYPVDEFDGDEIATITVDATVTDKSIVPYGSYFYSAFPFTKQGVYNRNPANRTSINEPADLVAFTADSVYDSDTDSIAVRIMAELPFGVTGAVVRKSTTGYPVDENDGEQVTTFTSDGVYIDTDLEEGNTYYYAAFPYKIENSTTIYNRSNNNRDIVVISAYKYLYGYDMMVDQQDPALRVTYPMGVMNEDYTGLTFDTSTHQPKWGDGSWNENEPFMPKPCILDVHIRGNSVTSVEVNSYLDPYDYSKKVDGTSATTDVHNPCYMMEWPKIYTKRWEDKDADGNTIYHFRCSDVKIDNEYECWCNYDKNNNEIDHFYTAIYLSDNGYGSRPNVIPWKCENASAAFVDNDDRKQWGFDAESLADRLLIQDLLVMMARNTDCEKIYGYAYMQSGNADWATLKTGSKTGGLFYNESTNYNSNSKSNKVFGMEHYWGLRTRVIPSWIWDSQYPNQYCVKITQGDIDSQILKDLKTDGNGYLIVEGPPVGCAGYISKMKTYPFGRLPIAIDGGSSSKYEADYLNTNYSSNGARAAEAGYVYGGALQSGPFAASFPALTTTSSTYAGSAISYKPIKTE